MVCRCLVYEGPTNVKALRAMFQEEARVLSLVQARDRPAIAEKPRRLPPTVPGGRSSSLISPVHKAVENSTMSVVPRVIFRDGTRSSRGKQPIPFSALMLQATPPNPPSPTPPPLPPHQNGHQEVHQNGHHNGGEQNSHHNGGEYYTATAVQSFKGCYIPFRLTCPPMKEQKKELPIHKEVPPQMKCKKKSLLLQHAFKSTKVSKAAGESTEEPTNVCLTNDRDLGGPGKLLLMNRHKTEDGPSLQAEHSSTEGLSSSPEILITPPLDERGEESTSMASTTQFFSTLEKAKKRFSPKNLLVYARPRSLCSDGVHHLPDHNSSTDKGAFRSIDQENHAPDHNIPASLPTCPPHLAVVSAQPFFKMNVSPHQFPSKRRFDREKAGLPPPPPPRKPLPDRGRLGPSPVKPPRPPWVYLSCYRPTTEHDRAKIEPDSCVDPDSEPPFIYNPDLVAPEFPDFELNLKQDTAEGNALNLAALELEATEFGSPDLPIDFRFPGFQTPGLELPSCEPPEISSFDCQSLTPSSHHELVFPDPVIIPEPSFLDFWDQKRAFPAPVLDPPTLTEMSADMVSVEPLITENVDHDPASVLNEDLQPLSRVCYQENYYETCDNVYEVVENINKFTFSQNSRKQKGTPKNPYGTPHPMKEEPRVYIWPRNSCKERASPENQEDREQKKREKHRLEKEKKEQREREKKDGEMKKKFKVTGHEEALYHARVTVASKLRKNDLPVKSGDTVGIIRTTNCPKGKWLARDTNHKYGYISVMNVELNIKEILELGKKAQAAGRGGNTEGDTISIGSRSSNRCPIPNNSFTDDDEEWTLDEEYLSPPPENRIHNRTVSMPDMLCCQANVQHTLSDVSTEDLDTQARQKALQRLAIFFQDKEDMTENEEPFNSIAEAHRVLSAVAEPQYSDPEVDFSDVELLPPPVLYADSL
uniref:Helically-extended SH3 domain-containing protein n=1 Tax=Esox lucius TaxID=8010 RepID=A0AAY5KMG6_ESOLU